MSASQRHLRLLPAASPSAASPTDAELVARVLEGDTWAQGAMYQRYAKEVASLATRMLGDRDDAMDVMQDVFAQAFLDLPKLRDGAALRGWLRRIAVHKVHRRFRRRKLRRALGLERREELGLDAFASPDCSPERLVELREVSRVLRTLALRRRSAWILHRVEGEALGDIADALGCSLATVKRDIQGAQAAIEAQLGDVR